MQFSTQQKKMLNAVEVAKNFLFFNQRNHVNVTRYVSLGGELKLERSIWFLCLWRAIFFLLLVKSRFFSFPLWRDPVGHTHIISLIACHFFFFFFDNIVPLYFAWLLVLKITLWSYDLWTQRDNFHVIHNCHCHKWLADKESELG